VPFFPKNGVSKCVDFVSNGNICQSRTKLAQIWQGQCHFSQKRLLAKHMTWHLANVANWPVFKLGQ
jgi:hypothetical protein